MIKAIICPTLSAVLKQLRDRVKKNEQLERPTVIFCEDRLTLAAERIICSEVGGTFITGVYTFARFLSTERGKRDGLLSSQGSAMAIRRIIDENRDRLKLFGKFSASSAASAVYDTIALLYSSKISAEDAMRASCGGLLESKLHDIAVIYSEYNAYLKNNGKTDRNAYLGELPSVICASEKIKNSDVIFLGFQSFTHTSLECVKAVMATAENTYGYFMGGEEELYVNEASASFKKAAENFGGAFSESCESGLIPEAEALRRNLFDPECFCSEKKFCTSNVHILEATDCEEELEFVAASIKRQVIDRNIRYAKISVMLPDVAKAYRDIERIFSQYRIPFYADMRYKLSAHPVCAFICDFLSCAASGCAPADTDAVIASPMYPAEDIDRDIYRNYSLRLACFRGGIKRQPDKQILDALKFDYDAVERVRKPFLEGIKFLPAKGIARNICGGLRKILELYGVKERLENYSKDFKDTYPAVAELSGRVYEAVLNVLAEAEDIAGDGQIQTREFIKILKSGFSATEISLIPPKADAVFVGDIANTANTGSEVVFACRLTSEVPSSSSDTALLTDREIAELEKANLDISPKIMQVNMRRRELTALNMCAFKDSLYLTYPASSGGEDNIPSEIIDYAEAVFATCDGRPLKPIGVRKVKSSLKSIPYFCSERLPALKRLNGESGKSSFGAIYNVLCERGFKRQADWVIAPEYEKSISDGKSLFVTYNSISPTVLETYFSCPYRNFMQQGLKLKEREEGVMRPLDTGNFIHSVLQKIAPELGGLTDEVEAERRGTEIAQSLLQTPQYGALTDSASGKYTAEELIKEAGAVSAGAFSQIENSLFEVESCETKCEMLLDGNIKINGRIDRIDSFGNMVRIIDYKTGTTDATPLSYYMGLKLQLPLYLTAVSKGRRAVGAYYFPASLEYKKEKDGVFRLQGFMDGSDEVVSATDIEADENEKSDYVNATLGKTTDTAMDGETFDFFLQYAGIVARKGTGEMLAGNIEPSPAGKACDYCKVKGSCGFEAGVNGEVRNHRAVKCSEIANIVRRRKGDK